MSARLIGELVEWLRTPAAGDLTPAERVVLFVVAERAHERTRKMLRHRVDDEQLVDRLSAVTGLARDGGLKRALQRLSDRDLEVRVPVGTGKDGRPVFTNRGHSMEFVLPQFPASISLPEGGTEPPAIPTHEPVGNPVDNPDGGAPADDPDGPEGEQFRTAIHPEGEQNRTAFSPKGGTKVPALSPSKNTPSTTSPSSGVRSQGAEEEGSTATPDDCAPDDKQFDFRSACAFLLTVPGPLQTTAETRATEQLGPNAKREAILIRAAQLAAKGVPA